MFGYMTESFAKDEGFTHHGKYFGIPIWMTVEECPMIATKWQPLEYLMSAFHVIEGFMHSILYPDSDNCFQLSVIKPIEG